MRVSQLGDDVQRSGMPAQFRPETAWDRCAQSGVGRREQRRRASGFANGAGHIVPPDAPAV
jgi:hypothetical protein